jgi:hypothetical protein
MRIRSKAVALSLSLVVAAGGAGAASSQADPVGDPDRTTLASTDSTNPTDAPKGDKHSASRGAALQNRT